MCPTSPENMPHSSKSKTPRRLLASNLRHFYTARDKLRGRQNANKASSPKHKNPLFSNNLASPPTLFSNGQSKASEPPDLQNNEHRQNGSPLKHDRTTPPPARAKIGCVAQCSMRRNALYAVRYKCLTATCCCNNLQLQSNSLRLQTAAITRGLPRSEQHPAFSTPPLDISGSSRGFTHNNARQGASTTRASPLTRHL